MNQTRKTDDVDRMIGQRIKTARQFRELSQDELAAKLQLSFQMIQKYENGNNRVAASRLWKIAEVLNMPIMYFYIQGEHDDAQLDESHKCSMTVSEQAALAGWRKLPPHSQESIKFLISSLLLDFEEESHKPL